MKRYFLLHSVSVLTLGAPVLLHTLKLLPGVTLGDSVIIAVFIAGFMQIWGLLQRRRTEENNNGSEKVRYLVTLYRNALDSKNEFVRFWAERKLNQCMADIARLTMAEELEYRPQDHDIVMDKLYGFTRRGDSIHAVSFNEKAEWEDAHLAGQYEDANEKAAKRRVNVERIFLYQNLSELASLQNIIDGQRDKNVKVRIADATRLEASHHTNRLIISTKREGNFTVYPEHSDGMFTKATVSWNEVRFEDFERIYQRVRLASTEWSG